MTKEQLIDMFTMRVEGNTFEEIGQKYGMSRQTVIQHFESAIKGRKLGKKYKRKYFEHWMNEKGLSVLKFSETYGISNRTVFKYLNGEDINMSNLKKIHEVTKIDFNKLMEVTGEEE